MVRSGLPLISALVSTLLAACASNPGVMQVGTDTYLVEKTSSTAVLGLDRLRSAAMAEASSYCQNHSGTAEIVEETATDPSLLPGRTSRVALRFRCEPWP